MRFINPIAFVRDIELSRAFYRDVLGLTIVEEDATIVIFAEHFAIHDGADLAAKVWGGGAVDPSPYGRRATCCSISRTTTSMPASPASRTAWR